MWLYNAASQPVVCKGIPANRMPDMSRAAEWHLCDESMAAGY